MTSVYYGDSATAGISLLDTAAPLDDDDDYEDVVVGGSPQLPGPTGKG